MRNSKAEQQQLRRLWGDLASDGRGEEAATHVPDWVNPTLKKVGWQPLSSKRDTPSWGFGTNGRCVARTRATFQPSK